MGAWNYGKSDDIITVGHYEGFCYTPSDEDIDETMELCDIQSKDYAQEILVRDFFDEVLTPDMDAVELAIPKDLHFYTVQVAPGYYQGFWVNIEQQYLALDSYKDRQTIQKEITAIKNFLINIVRNCGMRVHYPGWASGWEKTIEDSITSIKKAIKKERQKVKELPIGELKYYLNKK